MYISPTSPDYHLPPPPPPSLPLAKPRSRASLACTICRARKVRCDVLEKQPCTNCVAGNKVCEPAGRVQDRTQKRQSSSTTSTTTTTMTTTTANTEIAGLSPLLVVSDAGTQTELPRVSGYSIDAATAVSAGGSGGSLSPHWIRDRERQRAAPAAEAPGEMDSQPEVERQPSGAAPGVRHSIRTADDDIWARNLQARTADADELDQELGQDDVASAPTCKSSVRSLSSASAAPGRPRKRLKFGDEQLAHSMLAHMHGHAELVVTNDEHDLRVDRRQLVGPVAPRAARPYGTAPWIHADCQEHLDLLAHIPSEDRHYLYTMKKVFYFPPRSVAQALLETFFDTVYWILPIVDKCETGEMLEMLYTGRPTCPLLFHAIMFSACQHAEESLLRRAGFQTVTEAKDYFFRRAQLLYSFNTEPEQVVVIQSLMLMSYWWMDYTEEKDIRYWLVCAANLALTMGMHRSIPRSMNMAPNRRALWRRIFWTLFGREHDVAIALGQPLLLRLKDCNLQPLAHEDFQDHHAPSSPQSSLCPRCHLSTQQPLCHIEVQLMHVELACQAETFLLSLQDAKTPAESVSAIEAMPDLPRRETFYSPGMDADGFSADDSASWTRHSVCVVFHLINHERIATLYYRAYERALIGCKAQKNSESQGPNNPADTISNVVEDLEIKLQKARTNIYASAHRVARLMHAAFQGGFLPLTPSFINTSNFHALLSLAEEIMATSEDTPEHCNARLDFSRMLDVVCELRKYWASASWCYLMYSNLEKRGFSGLGMPGARKKLNSGSRTVVTSSLLSQMNGHRPQEFDADATGASMSFWDSWDFLMPLTDSMVPMGDQMDTWGGFDGELSWNH